MRMLVHSCENCLRDGVFFVAPKNMSEKNSQIEEKKMNQSKSGVCRFCKVVGLGRSKKIIIYVLCVVEKECMLRKVFAP